MKNQKQTKNETLELFKNPLFIFIMIIGSPYYIVHKIVQWASVKTDKNNDQVEIVVA